MRIAQVTHQSQTALTVTLVTACGIVGNVCSQQYHTPAVEVACRARAACTRCVRVDVLSARVLLRAAGCTSAAHACIIKGAKKRSVRGCVCRRVRFTRHFAQNCARTLQDAFSSFSKAVGLGTKRPCRHPSLFSDSICETAAQAFACALRVRAHATPVQDRLLLILACTYI